MNKTDLVAAVAERSGLTKKDAERVVSATFDTITAELVKGEKVQISGFGIFEVKAREARVGVIPAPRKPSKFPHPRHLLSRQARP